MKKFPTNDPSILRPMFEEIGNVLSEHLGINPKAFVLIVTDGKTAQTMFAGNDPADMTRLLTEGAENHFTKAAQQTRWSAPPSGKGRAI